MKGANDSHIGYEEMDVLGIEGQGSEGPEGKMSQMLQRPGPWIPGPFLLCASDSFGAH